MASITYQRDALKEAADGLKTEDALRRYADATLPRIGKAYECPSCKSGTGKNRTPAFSIHGDKWKCFSCNKGGDVFDLAGIVNHIEGHEHYREQVEIVADTLGYRIDDGGRAKLNLGRQWGTQNGDHSGDRKPSTTEAPDPGERDYSIGRQEERAYIAECQSRIDAPEAIAYLQARGFTIDEIHSFGFGYDPRSPQGWKDSAGNWVNGPRIVIPWKGSDYYHIDRAMADAEDISQAKYAKPCSDDTYYKSGPKEGQLKRHGVGEQPFYNPSIIKDRWSGVFVVEGVLDALAVEAMGQPAIALAGTDYEQTLRKLASSGYQGLIVLMLDGDKPGCDKQAEAAKLAGDLKLKHYSADFRSITKCKDACEALAKDREAGRKALETIWGDASFHQSEVEAEARREVMKTLSLQDAAQVANDIYLCHEYEEPTPTGFHSLDSIMHGGLNSGLVILGATSSAGKTTFVTQVADFIAEHGRPVLFVTMEQSARELVSKSLSRLMAERGFDNVNVWDMGNSDRRQAWPEGKTKALFDSISHYDEAVAPNLVIMAAEDRPTVEQVETAARAVRDERHVSPVIVLDYLQLLSPLDPHQSDKQAVDYNVSQLRRISRPSNLGSPIIAISSLNRSSYSGSITMEAFKESGAVEYSADVLLGLQPYHYKEDIREEKGKDKREQRAEELIDDYRHQSTRKAEIVVLKNRNGYIPSETLPFTFYAPSSRFVEGVR